MDEDVRKVFLMEQLIKEQNVYMTYYGYSCIWDPWAGRLAEYLLHGQRRIKP